MAFAMQGIHNDMSYQFRIKLKNIILSLCPLPKVMALS